MKVRRGTITGWVGCEGGVDVVVAAAAAASCSGLRPMPPATLFSSSSLSSPVAMGSEGFCSLMVFLLAFHREPTRPVKQSADHRFLERSEQYHASFRDG